MFASAPTVNMINGFEMEMNANGVELFGNETGLKRRTPGLYNAVHRLLFRD